MTDQITKFNFISPETFEGKTFNPSEINFVDITDSVLNGVNAQEKFTPRYGLEFNSSTNMNVQGGNYEQNGTIGSTSLKNYQISNVSTYASTEIAGMNYNQDGSINLTDISAYAILPFSAANGDILCSRYIAAAYNGIILGKRTSDTTFKSYISYNGGKISLYSYTSDNKPLLENVTSVMVGANAGYSFVGFDTTNEVIYAKYYQGTPTDSTSVNNVNPINYANYGLSTIIPECDSILFIPSSSSSNSCFVAHASGSLANVSTFGDIANLITSYILPITVDKTLYLDNTANTIQPDDDTIVIENQKLTSTCQRQFNTGSSLTMTTAMMTGSNGVTLEIQSANTNSIIPRQCFNSLSVSGTQIYPTITTSAYTGITIPSQNSEGNMVLADPYRYIAFPFDPTKDAFITQSSSTSSNRYNRAMLGKMQNDGTFRLLYIPDSQYLFKVSAHNSDGTCDFTYDTFGSSSSVGIARIMWLDTTDKLMYYRGGGTSNVSTLYSSSVTDSFINDFCQCDTIIYSPLTGASGTASGFGVLHNIGTSGDLEERLASTTLVQPTETYQKSILTVNTTWLTQFIQDTFGLTPQS